MSASLSEDEQEALLDANDITIGRFIGVGGFGYVCQGTYRGDTVAVKVIREAAQTNSDQGELYWRETRNLVRATKRRDDGQSTCPNVVRLIGYYSHPGEMCLVMEYADNGSLKSYIHGEPRKDYTWTRVKKWMEDIFAGVSQIHLLDIVHRDLNPKNILLFNNFNDCKICDLGAATDCASTTIALTANMGTFEYMAPEVVEGTEESGQFTLAPFRTKISKYSNKSDIFSLGVIIWEILSCREPYFHLKKSDVAVGNICSGQRQTTQYDFLVKVKNGERPQRLKNCPTLLDDMQRRCWDISRELRPSVVDLIGQLKKFSEDYAANKCNFATLPLAIIPADVTHLHKRLVQSFRPLLNFPASTRAAFRQILSEKMKDSYENASDFLRTSAPDLHAAISSFLQNCHAQVPSQVAIPSLEAASLNCSSAASEILEKLNGLCSQQRPWNSAVTPLVVQFILMSALELKQSQDPERMLQNLEAIICIPDLCDIMSVTVALIETAAIDQLERRDGPELPWTPMEPTAVAETWIAVDLAPITSVLDGQESNRFLFSSWVWKLYGLMTLDIPGFLQANRLATFLQFCQTGVTDTRAVMSQRVVSAKLLEAFLLTDTSKALVPAAVQLVVQSFAGEAVHESLKIRLGFVLLAAVYSATEETVSGIALEGTDRAAELYQLMTWACKRVSSVHELKLGALGLLCLLKNAGTNATTVDEHQVQRALCVARQSLLLALLQVLETTQAVHTGEQIAVAQPNEVDRLAVEGFAINRDVFAEFEEFVSGSETIEPVKARVDAILNYISECRLMDELDNLEKL
ncbi:putative Mitogen-activated protein kinase kinase kinase 7 [Hypsibius exemplaris]|uniref:Mitogen-activated protein kinase kinase kinase 7 n=1 Tax=Hypsibius exemplaris TaxID=2072580 RepID=A0A9X6RPB9_HYPEX|nr:putative Mitogen-activated protein kinase kinase kinase 7 [Hypsibius exemplaris]